MSEDKLRKDVDSLKDDGNDGHKLTVICEILYEMNKNSARIADALEKIEERPTTTDIFNTFAETSIYGQSIIKTSLCPVCSKEPCEDRSVYPMSKIVTNCKKHIPIPEEPPNEN